MTDKPQTEIVDRRDAGLFVHSSVDDLGLDVYEFRVYARIVRRAGQRGACWESNANVADDTGMSTRKVYDALKVLEGAGLITCDRSGRATVKYLNGQDAWKVHTPAELAALRDKILNPKPAGDAGIDGPDTESPTDAAEPPAEGHEHPETDSDADGADGAPAGADEPADAPPDDLEPRQEVPVSDADAAPGAERPAAGAGQTGTTRRQRFSQEGSPEKGSAPDGAGVATAPPTAQDLLADHIDACNVRPPDRVVGQTAREIGQLLDEGIDVDAIRGGLAKLRRKALHPSTLASLVNEHLNAPKPDRPSERVGSFDRTGGF